MNVIEQYQALQKRENANSDRLCELQVRADAIKSLFDTPKMHPDVIMRRLDELDADFQNWREERDQLRADALSLGMEYQEAQKKN